MKQMLILERSDLATLKSGTSLELHVGGQRIVLAYEQPRERSASNSGHSEKSPGKPKRIQKSNPKGYICPLDRERFKTPQQFGSHVRLMHRGRKVA